MKIRLTDVLRPAGFDPTIRTKLVRHKDARVSAEELRQNELGGQTWLELYQGYQKKPVFNNVKQVVSFYGLPGTRAGFYGVYRVLDRIPARDGPPVPSGQRWGQDCNYFYKLEQDRRFHDLRDRLVIEWGKGAINWHQKLSEKSDKEVLEVLAPGRKLLPFVDYLGFSLTQSQLKDLFRDEEAHRDWKIPLSCAAGVYLILAETSGEMYVGSAYGEEGIWGRWREYGRSGDGDNVRLRELIEKDSSYPGKFRFSILQILPKSTAKNEALRWEALYKGKLGKRATRLNSN
jgi:hypothetical protein